MLPRQAMEFQFKLNEDDYVSAHLSYMKRYPWRFLWWFRYPVAVAGAAIALAVDRPETRGVAGWLFLTSVGIGVYIVLAYRWDRRQEFQKTLSGRRPVLAKIDEQSITLIGEASQKEASWPEISDVYEFDRGFLFRTWKRKTFFVPKSEMSRFQVQELRDLISTHAKGRVQLLPSLS